MAQLNNMILMNYDNGNSASYIERLMETKQKGSMASYCNECTSPLNFTRQLDQDVVLVAFNTGLHEDIKNKVTIFNSTS